MTETETEFDPYVSWLNINEPDRPLSPYQLLRLRPLESDLGRIRGAYEQQEDAISRYAERADPKIVGDLRQELLAALQLLSNSERKAVLDAGIRRHNEPLNRVIPQTGIGGPAQLIPCGRCQRENPTGQRFCSQCGQGLFQRCPKCGCECVAVEKFCGSCGTDIWATLGDMEADCQRRLDAALALVQRHHFDQAIRELRSVAGTSDPRLGRYAEQALAEIARVEQTKKAASGVAVTSLDEAHQAMANFSYERAIVILEKVPHPLRNEEHRTLLGRATFARNEILSLSGEIRQFVEQKMLGELAPKLERLLALVPSHEQGRRLAEQLRERQVKIAKARLKEFRYQESLDQLDKIPAVVMNEEVETLRDTSAELNALTNEIRQGALADRNHIALAERLVKLAPQDPTAPKLREMVLQRAKVKCADVRLGASNLAAPPKRTIVSAPVDWLANFKQAECTDKEAQHTLQQHPGQFFVALGLALQGLGLAAFNSDLSPKPASSGILGGISSLTASRRQATTAWGLDLSDHSLRAIQLQVTSSKAVQIKAAHWIEVKPPGARIDVSEQVTSAQQALASFLATAGDLKNAKVCVDLPSQRVLGRFFELPPMPAKKINDALQYEAKQQIPIPFEELCWSHAALDAKESKADEQPRRFMIQAARESHVRDRLGRFREAGITVDFIQSNAIALANALRFEFFREPNESSGAIAGIDVGGDSTNVVVCSPRCVWFRTFGHGGEVFMRGLQNELTLTSEQSALLLRNPERARRFSRWIDVMQPMYVQFGSEVMRSLASFQKLWPEEPVRQAYGLGGAFPAVGLLRYLRTGA